jgi:hypothetical protein
LANGTLAVFAALGILALSAWTDPAARLALVDPESAPALSTAAMKALLSTAVFLACGSLPVCWVLHTAVAGLLWSGGAQPDADFVPAEAADVGTLEPTIV